MGKSEGRSRHGRKEEAIQFSDEICGEGMRPSSSSASPWSRSPPRDAYEKCREAAASASDAALKFSLTLTWCPQLSLLRYKTQRVRTVKICGKARHRSCDGRDREKRFSSPHSVEARAIYYFSLLPFVNQTTGGRNYQCGQQS